MSDIYISYSRQDQARVKSLAEALHETCGWSVWWDPHIPADKTFDEIIETALDEARCVVVVWSKTSVISRWVNIEAGEGLDRGILVPVTIDNANIPLAFSRIQTADLSAWQDDTNAEVFQKLRADLTGVLGETAHKNSVANLATASASSQDDSKKNVDHEPRNIGKYGSRTINPQVQNHSFQEPELVRITGGKFLIGSPKSEKGRDNNEQQYEIFIDDFAIGKYPVTFAEYDRYCDEVGLAKPDDKGWGRSNRPVINVSWMEAHDYAKWLARVTVKPYRLPTEAEWEFSARGGTQTAYWWGEKFEQGRSNSNGCHKKTTPVDKFKPNPFGLYDMLGNVWEWTGSLYEQVYGGSKNKSAEKEDYSRRVIRGGSWHYGSGYARSANRYGYDSDDRSFDVGFRLVQD